MGSEMCIRDRGRDLVAAVLELLHVVRARVHHVLHRLGRHCQPQLRESTTLLECISFCRVPLGAIELCNVASLPLSVVMFCLMMNVSSLISACGFSNRLLDCASCVSFESLLAVAWCPHRSAKRLARTRNASDAGARSRWQLSPLAGWR